MRSAVCILVLLSFAWPAAALAQDDPERFDHGNGTEFYIAAKTSALQTPLTRQRVRLFHHALRYVFAYNGSVRVSPTTECARRSGPAESESWRAAGCDVRPVRWPRSNSPVTFESLQRHPRRTVLLHAGEQRPNPDFIWQSAIYLDVSALTSEQLALRACEIASEQRPIRCRVTETLERLDHPGDDALIVDQGTEFAFEARKVTFRGENSRRLYVGPAEPSPFIVQASVVWPTPVETPTVFAHVSEDPLEERLEFVLDGPTAYLVQRDAAWVQFVVVEPWDGHSVRGPSHREVDLSFTMGIAGELDFQGPVVARAELPEIPVGYSHLQIGVWSPHAAHPRQPQRVHFLNWGTADAGQFRHCTTGETTSLVRNGIGFHVRGEQFCLFAPWWSGDVQSARAAGPGFGVVIGSIKQDPTFWLFTVLLFPLSFFGFWFGTRPPRATQVAFRVGAKEGYREAATDAWRLVPVAELKRQKLGPASVPVRLLWTPMGTLAAALTPRWVKQPGHMFRQRRVFFIRAHTLLVESTSQFLFMRNQAGKNLEADALAQGIASAEDIRLASDEEGVAKDLAKNQASASRVIAMLASFLLTGASLGVGFGLAARTSSFTQRTPFALTALAALLAGCILVKLGHLAVSARGKPTG